MGPLTLLYLSTLEKPRSFRPLFWGWWFNIYTTNNLASTRHTSRYPIFQFSYSQNGHSFSWEISSLKIQNLYYYSKPTFWFSLGTAPQPHFLCSQSTALLVHKPHSLWYRQTICHLSLCSNSYPSQVQFSSVQSLSCVRLCNPVNCSAPDLPVHQKLQILLKLMPIESVMPSSHLILCHPLLLLPPIPPNIRVFSNELTLRMRWPTYWSFSFSISPSNEHPGLISFKMD